MTSAPLRRRLGESGWLQRIAGGTIGSADAASAAALLGDDHRLVRTLELFAVMRRQLLLSSFAFVAAGLAFAFDVPNAALWLAASGVVGLALALAMVARRAVGRDQARELIIEGREGLPLALLARERRRLVSPGTGSSLARALERLTKTAAAWPCTFPSARPVFDVHMIRAATPDLRALAELLRTAPAQARAVALTERLLTSCSSPLYGDEPEELHRELNLIRAELERR